MEDKRNKKPATYDIATLKRTMRWLHLQKQLHQFTFIAAKKQIVLMQEVAKEAQKQAELFRVKIEREVRAHADFYDDPPNEEAKEEER